MPVHSNRDSDQEERKGVEYKISTGWPSWTFISFLLMASYSNIPCSKRIRDISSSTSHFRHHSKFVQASHPVFESANSGTAFTTSSQHGHCPRASAAISSLRAL